MESIVINNRKICKLMSKEFLKLDVIIPNEQRIRDDEKVKEIVTYQLSHLKDNGWCNFMGLLNIHCCHETGNMYLVDGQHRYESIRKINETNNIPITFELVDVNTMEELKENYKILNKNTPLPEFPESIDKNIPEDVARYFRSTYPNIWSKSSRARRPHIYFNYFQEALGMLVKELSITSKEYLLDLIIERNNSLSKWSIESFPDNKNITQLMMNKCKCSGFYLGLYKHVSDEFRYEWVRDIIKHNTGKDMKQPKICKGKKNIPKSLKTSIWDKYIGKDKRSAYCICCNNNEIKVENFHAGHIVPEREGGLTDDTNLLPVCSQCNTSMGVTNMELFVKEHFTSNYIRFCSRKYIFSRSKLFDFL